VYAPETMVDLSFDPIADAAGVAALLLMLREQSKGRAGEKKSFVETVLSDGTVFSRFKNS
jgi:hypothetical protein